MNETLYDLKMKREAVIFAFNDLYDDLREEVYRDDINCLKRQIEANKRDLEVLKEAYVEEVVENRKLQIENEYLSRVACSK